MTIGSPTGVTAAVVTGLIVASTVWFAPVSRFDLMIRPRLSLGLGALVSVAGCAIGWRSSAPTVAVAVPLVAAIVVAEQRRRDQDAVLDEVDRQLPLLIDGMVQRLRAGSGLHGVCLDPPAVGGEVDTLTLPMKEALANGVALRIAVGRFGLVGGEESAVDYDGSRLVATALTAAATYGGPATPALQRLRLTLTARAQARADSQARSSQGLASARLLVAAPAVFAVLLASFDERLANLYLREPIGTACVSVCIALSYGGWPWMHHMVASLVSTVGRRR